MDPIDRETAIDALWKALYEYEDKTEKQFQESEDLDVGDWILHRIFVQNMSDIDRQTILNLPSAQPERKKPVFKTGESVYHVSYADGTGGFKKNKWADWTCPDCGWFVGEQYIPRRHNQQKCNYCAKCGCAIDWSDADMRGE